MAKHHLFLLLVIAVSISIGLNARAIQTPSLPTFSPPPALPTSCEKYDKYFPKEKIESFFGKKISGARYNDQQRQNEADKKVEEVKKTLETLQKYGVPKPSQPPTEKEPRDLFKEFPGLTSWANCGISVGDLLPSNFFTLSFYEFNSGGNARSAFSQGIQKLEKSGSKVAKLDAPKLGDETVYYRVENTGLNTNTYVVAARRSNFIVGGWFFDASYKKHIENLLRGLLDKLSPEEKKPVEVEREAPVIESFTPSSASAGVERSFNKTAGNVAYKDNAIILNIKGQNLGGASISSENTGLDKKPGIQFKKTTVNSERTEFNAYMIVRPTAKDGETSITLTNSGGKSASFTVNITITGTQYLKRLFAGENIKFFGNWPQTMPAKEIEFLATDVEDGLKSIRRGKYRILGITTHIYEPGFWEDVAEEKYCGDRFERGFAAVGCADWSDRTIHVAAEPDEIPATILHEAAHKLNFYYKGFYLPLTSSSTDFEKEWKTAVENLKSCPYLPLTVTSWKDGTDNNEPHCGFVRAYGAFRTSEGVFYEDVATYAETVFFDADKTSRISSLGASYTDKIKLIEKYGF